MIVLKSREEIDRMRAASAVVAEVLATLREAVKPGVSTAELDAISES
jgi:methionyl aminopeptidase